MSVPDGLLLAIGAYVLLGVAVGACFVFKGVQRIDHAARGKGAPWHFRLIILPGAAALWPLVLTRWLRAPRTSADTHS